MPDFAVSFQKNDKVLTRAVDADTWKDAYQKVATYYGYPIHIFYIRRADRLEPEWDPLGRYQPDPTIEIIHISGD